MYSLRNDFISNQKYYLLHDIINEAENSKAHFSDRVYMCSLLLCLQQVP